MSTAVWPPLPPEQLVKEEEASLARELAWLLSSLQETLASLKSGLEECIALLAPQQPGSTLVLSSLRSESLKGFVTRVGTTIIKGDIHLRLPSLPPPRGSLTYKLTFSSSPAAPTFYLPQLSSARKLINESLDIIDVTTWTGDAKDANFISGQLHLLFDNIQEARQALQGGEEVQGRWWESPIDEGIFDPPLPPTISFHLSVSEASLVLCVRTLEPTAPNANSTFDSFSGFNFRDRLAVAIGASRRSEHDENNEVFMHKGHEVKVKEKVRVESGDPSLMAMMAKLSALEHNVALSLKALDIVMGKDE
ncbi:MAG: hypothetical protein M1835_004716 [Candelina submexicana]|nr:MAG: hypothetical protein M1835_004716 [Candelina submexicana]